MRRNMVTLMLLLALGCVASLPVKYDQRQDGDLNVHAHLENIVIVYISKGSGLGINLVDLVAKKAAAKHHAQTKEDSSPAERSDDVIIADSPYGIKVEVKAAEDEPASSTPEERPSTEVHQTAVEPQASADSPGRKDAEVSPGKTPSITKQLELSPDKKLSDKEPSLNKDTEHKDDNSPKEAHKEQLPTEDSSENKSSEGKNPEDKSSEEDKSGENSSEEQSSSEAPLREKEEPKKSPKVARVLDRADDKGTAKLKQILVDGVEPCLQVSDQGLCQPTTRAAKRRLERQQRQRLIEILSSGVSPAN